MRYLIIFCLCLFVNSFMVGSAFASLYALEIRAILQGAYSEEGIDNSVFMHDALREKRLIPVTQPFNNAPHHYTGSESFSEALLNDSINDQNGAIVDWVLIELRDPDNPARIVVRKAALLTRGGAVVNTCLLYTSPSPRDGLLSRMPSSA